MPAGKSAVRGALSAREQERRNRRGGRALERLGLEPCVWQGRRGNVFVWAEMVRTAEPCWDVTTNQSLSNHEVATSDLGVFVAKILNDRGNHASKG